MRRIDDEHFPEFGGKVGVVAQVVDQIADRHMLGHRDEIAAHQPPGGFFRIGQRRFDRRAVFRLHFGEDGLLVFLVEILDHRDGVVGIEQFGDIGDGFGGQILDEQLADVIVELGDDLDAHQVADRAGQRAALVAVDQLEQVGDVGGVERLDQGVDRVVLARFQRFFYPADEIGLEPVLLVEVRRCPRRPRATPAPPQRRCRSRVAVELLGIHAAPV